MNARVFVVERSDDGVNWKPLSSSSELELRLAKENLANIRVRKPDGSYRVAEYRRVAVANG